MPPGEGPGPGGPPPVPPGSGPGLGRFGRFWGDAETVWESFVDEWREDLSDVFGAEAADFLTRPETFYGFSSLIGGRLFELGRLAHDEDDPGFVDDLDEVAAERDGELEPEAAFPDAAPPRAANGNQSNQTNQSNVPLVHSDKGRRGELGTLTGKRKRIRPLIHILV